MTDGLTPGEWARLLEAVEGPTTYGEVVHALAEARNLSHNRAGDLVDGAIEREVLIEDPDAGQFGQLFLEDGDSGETPPLEGDSAGANPGCDAEEPGSSTDGDKDGRQDASETDDVVIDNPPEIEAGVFPEDLQESPRWLTWKETDDGRKVPRAPYENPDWPDKFVSAQDPDVWTDFETVEKWTSKLPGYGAAFNIRDREEYPGEECVLIDYDDARDPETGRIHPVVREHIERARSYADVSTSGTGVHIFCQGELPEGVKAVDADLPGADGFPDAEIEVYDSARYSAMTGDHIASTPRETTDCQAFIEELADEYATVATGTPDELLRDPETSKEELADVETTTDIQDVLDAIQHTGPRDIRLRSSVTHERGDGSKSLDPAWASSKSGTRLAQVGDGWVYRKGMVGLDALQVVALEERIIHDESDYPSGEDFWNAVEALRNRGAHIPEYEPSESETEQVAVLPPTVRDLSTATSGWDWRHTAAQGEDALTIEDARARTVEAIADAYTSGDHVLIEALPTMGKSYGSIKAVAETGRQITVLTGRGRKEQYEQFKQWCDEHGLNYYTLPAFTRDCDTANGEHGEEWADTVRDWYNRGATPKEIHKSAEYVLDRPLPCQEHEGHQCLYASKWDFDPDDYDVLIGHYSHAYKSKVTSGRVCVFDEFPDAYETHLGVGLQGAISYWLETAEGVPFEDYTDLLENRTDQERRADALLWFEEHGVEADEMGVFDDASAHAAAPLAVFTILAADDLGNGFEQADIEDVGTGVRNRKNDAVSILRPPALDYASGVVALDGTPTKEMWELSLGEPLNHRLVLQPKERTEYIQDALNLNIVRATEAVKPYNSADHVNTEQDAALLEQIREAHGETPSLITSSTAEHEYDSEGVLDLVNETKHYGNVLGSNEFEDTRLGAVIGSNHYGDHYIKKWGAYAGTAVERNDEKGEDLSYGRFGDKILTHMREHDSLQATMRFGRDGNGAVVYVHTNTLPEWVPIAGEGRVVTTWSDGMKQVLEALEDLGTATTAEVVEHPVVEISRQQVFDHLEQLRERGVLGREQDPDDGRCLRWSDDGLHRVNDHGDVELDPVGLDDLEDDEVRQLARSSIYTWEFTNSGEGDGGRVDQDASDPSGTGRPVTDGGDPTSHDGG
jgi:hypothetical protein